MQTPYSVDEKQRLMREFEIFQDCIVSIRSLRKNLSIPSGKKIVCYYHQVDSRFKVFIEENRNLFLRLASLDDFIEVDNTKDLNLISNIASDLIISIEKNSQFDYNPQIVKLKKDLVSQEKLHTQSNNKLKNKGFLESAPKEIIDKEKEKLKKSKEDRDEIKNLLRQLS